MFLFVVITVVHSSIVSGSKTQPQFGGSVARVAAPPHAVVVVAVVVADVDLGRPGHTACTSA